jgi:hypothetical protein
MAGIPPLPNSEQAEKLKQGGYLPSGFTLPIDFSATNFIRPPEEQVPTTNITFDPSATNALQPPPAPGPEVIPASFTPPDNMTPMDPAAPGQLATDVDLNTAPSEMPTGQSSGIELMAPNTAGYDIQQAAMLQAAKVGDAEGMAQAAEQKRIMDEDKKLIEINNASELKRQGELDTAKGELDKSVAEFGSAKIDPNRYWANRTTGDKVLAGIGLFLGSFGQGGNRAVEIINNAIKTDIDAQKADIETKKDVASAKKGIYSDMFSRFRDKRLAEEATRAAYLDNAMMKLKQIEAQYSGPETKAKSALLYGQLEQQKADAQSKFMLEVASKKGLQQQTQDPTLNKLMRLPDSLQKRGLDELGQVQAWNALTDDLIREYDSTKNVGASGKIPSMLGGNADAYEASKGKIAGAIVGKVPGIKSDSDFRNIVEPMLPRAGETGESAQRKLQIFKDFLKANGPTSPLLDSMGMRPTSVSERLNVKKGLAK